MKKDVLFIAPYEDIWEMAQEVNAELGGPCHVEVVSFVSASVERAKTFKAEGGSIIISRGGIAKGIKEQVDIAVIEVPVTAYDLVDCVRRAKTHGRNMAISANMIGQGRLADIEQELDVAMTVIPPVQESELEQEILKVKAQGIGVVVGGVAPVSFAEKNGLKGVLMRVDKQSIATAFVEAMELSEINNHALLNSPLAGVLSAVSFGVFLVRSNGKVAYVNRMGETMMQVSMHRVVGRHIRDVSALSGLLAAVNEAPMDVYLPVQLDNADMVLRHFLVTDSNGDDMIGIFLYPNGFVETLGNVVKKGSEQSQPHIAQYHFNQIITRASVMQESISQATAYAKVDSTILITGETGTGKELMAQSIHNASRRQDGPFLAINCASIPEGILESELFGYDEGAFTGARRKGKKGYFELANGGTLFLDEIGELPLSAQSKLLRVLQEREVMHLGGSRAIPINVRVIAATLSDLLGAVQQGTFRKDLYYRLNILRILLPSLQQRSEDIPLLTLHLVEKIAKRIHLRPITITAEGLAHLTTCPWQGNVRELENVVERLVILHPGQTVGVPQIQECMQDICTPMQVPAVEPQALTGGLGNVEREKLIQALVANDYQKEKVCAALGISMTTLWRRMKKHNISI